MTIAVRPLHADDRPEWTPLWEGYLAFYRVELGEEVTETAWRRLLDPLVDVHGLAACAADGRMIGFVHYLFHPVTWAIAPRCYLEDLFVEPGTRGAGAGRRLIEAVYAAADARDADQVYWLTQDFNATARRLYDRMASKTDFIKYRR